MNQEKINYHAPANLAESMNALSTCAHILRTPDVDIPAESVEALKEIRGTAKFVAEMIGKTLRVSSLSTELGPKLEVVGDTSEETTTTEDASEKSTTETAPAEENSDKKESTEENTSPEKTEETTDTPDASPETSEEDKKEESKEEPKKEDSPFERAETDEQALKIVRDKVFAKAASKKIARIDDLDQNDRLELKRLIAATYPKTSEKGNAKNKKVLAKFITSLLNEYLAAVKEGKDIVNNEEAGENLLRKVNEKAKQQQTNTTTPAKEEDKKPQASEESKEKKTDTDQAEKPDYVELLKTATDKKMLETASIEIRKAVGTGKNMKVEDFNKNKGEAAATVQKILLERSEKEKSVKDIIAQHTSLKNFVKNTFKKAAEELQKKAQ